MPNRNNKTKGEKIRHYAKYANLPYQLFGLIVVFAFIGYQADKYLQNEKYYCTAVLILVAFAAFMYKLFITLKKER